MHLELQRLDMLGWEDTRQVSLHPLRGEKERVIGKGLYEAETGRSREQSDRDVKRINKQMENIFIVAGRKNNAISRYFYNYINYKEML